jgi:hypothetical protein
MAKEARVQEMLREQERVLEAETLKLEAQEAKVALIRRTPGSRSAPALPSARSSLESPANHSKEDLERQKLRVACKMEMVDFFDAYNNNVSKMSAEQTSALLAKLHGGLQLGQAANPHTPVVEEAPCESWPDVADDRGEAPDPFDVIGHGSGRHAWGPEPGDDPDPSVGLQGNLLQDENQSIQGHLRDVQDRCNRAFDAAVLEDDGF